MNEKEKEKFVGVVLPEELIDRIQQEGMSQERSMSGQIRYILKQYYDKNGDEK